MVYNIYVCVSIYNIILLAWSHYVKILLLFFIKPVPTRAFDLHLTQVLF